MRANVLIIIGAGGIGQAIARRQGAGMSVLLADSNQGTLEAAAGSLKTNGYEVTTRQVDVSNRESVRALAEAASGLGIVAQVVHTAGLSPNMASPEKILAVDLLGTALVLEEFGRVISPGGAGVVISSMAGYMPLLLFPGSMTRHLPLLRLTSYCSCPSCNKRLSPIRVPHMAYPSVQTISASRLRVFDGASEKRVLTPSVPVSSQLRWPSMNWTPRSARSIER